MSVGNWFQINGALKANDLLVIRREEGLAGQIRETAKEDLVLTLFCTERRLRKYEGWLDCSAE